MIFKKVN